jgi:hypothetical protein
VIEEGIDTNSRFRSKRFLYRNGRGNRLNIQNYSQKDLNIVIEEGIDTNSRFQSKSC